MWWSFLLTLLLLKFILLILILLFIRLSNLYWYDILYINCLSQIMIISSKNMHNFFSNTAKWTNFVLILFTNYIYNFIVYKEYNINHLLDTKSLILTLQLYILFKSFARTLLSCAYFLVFFVIWSIYYFILYMI